MGDATDLATKGLSGTATGSLFGPWGSAIGGLVGLGVGAWQLAKGLNGPDKPIYPSWHLPEAAQKELDLARNLASNPRLPGESTIEGRLDQATTNSISTLQRNSDTPAGIINGASRAYSKQQEEESKLGISAAENYNRNQMLYSKALGDMAGWEAKGNEWNRDKWNYDENLPYAQSQGRVNAGIQNIVGGANNLSADYTNKYLLKLLYGKGEGVNMSVSNDGLLGQTPFETPTSTGNLMANNPINPDQQTNIPKSYLDKWMYGYDNGGFN